MRWPFRFASFAIEKAQISQRFNQRGRRPMFCIQAKNAYLRVKQINGATPAMILTRRSLIKTASLLGLGSLSGFKVLAVERAEADDRVFSHGNNIYGELKYPPDFKHFDYVNPNAPKGGRLRL